MSVKKETECESVGRKRDELDKQLSRLIEMVKGNPVLWHSHHLRRSPQATQEGWDEINKAMGFPYEGKDAKTHWKNVKDYFRIVIERRIENKKANRISKRWKFEKQMAFLIPHLNSRGFSFEEKMDILEDEERDQFLESSEDAPHSTSMEQNPKMVHIPVVVQILKNATEVIIPNNEFEEITQNSEADQNGYYITDTSRTSEMRQELKPADVKQEPLDYEENGGVFTHQEKRKTITDSFDVNESKCVTKGDSLLNFFSSMFNTTSQLPPQSQLQVKRKIFEIVTEAEESFLTSVQGQLE